MTAKKSTKNLKKESEKVSVQTKVKNIGLVAVKPPKDICENDKHCPFHGNMSLRGRMLTDLFYTPLRPMKAVVEWTWKRKIPKYERYEKRRTKVIVHNPACINALVGDTVKIMETRKISKTKNFVIVEKV